MAPALLWSDLEFLSFPVAWRHTGIAILLLTFKKVCSQQHKPFHALHKAGFVVMAWATHACSEGACAPVRYDPHGR